MWEYVLMSVAPVVCSVITAALMRWKTKSDIARLKADLKAAEETAKGMGITNDVNVIDLYKKVYADLSVTLKQEYDKFDVLVADLSKEVALLKRAINKVSTCKYSRGCPVTKELERSKGDEK